MVNSVDPGETALYESSHPTIHRLQRYLYWSAGMKVLTDSKRKDIYSISKLFIVKRNVYSLRYRRYCLKG